MNIQEFSHRLGRDDHPSELIRALRSLRCLDVDRLRQWRRIGPDWGVWNDPEPRVPSGARSGPCAASSSAP